MADESKELTAEAQWKKWERELNAADEHEKSWKERGREIVKRFRDERDAAQKDVSRFNILFSNTEVLKGAAYQRTPIPEVRRRYNDKDPVGKAGAEVLDRCLSYAMDSYDFDGTIRAVVEDSLLPGRGVARVKYVPQIAKVGEVEQVVYEEVKCEHQAWEMFRYSPATCWDKVRWVAFGDLLTRQDLVSQFPGVGEEVKLDWAPEGKKIDESNDVVKRAIVWSIWNKTDRKLYVWASGYNRACLAVVDDPLRLEQFFPCPKPLYAISTTNSLIPVPDYTQYEDQAIELDEITGRITALMDALRRRGVYDKNQPELHELARAGDNEFIPVENMAALAEKGGIEKSFMELPIDGIAKVLTGLYEQREQLKQTIYEVTGISDILRGSTDASETLGAQELKAQYGGLRIKSRQQEVQRFARDILRLKAEIMAEHFSPQTLAQISGVQLPSAQDKQIAQQALMQAQQAQQPPDPKAVEVLSSPAWEEVMQVISNDKLRGFRIDIETDSTIQPDQQIEQQSRIEAITAFGGLLQQTVPAVQLGIMPPELATKSIAWVIRSFKNPGELEEVLDKLAEQPPQPPGMSPEQVADLEKREQDVQKATQKVQEDGIALIEERAKFNSERVEAEAALKGERAIMDAEREAMASATKVGEVRVAALEDAAITKIDAARDALKTVQQADTAAKKKVPKTDPALMAAVQGLTEAIKQFSKPRKTVTKLVRGADGRAESSESVSA